MKRALTLAVASAIFVVGAASAAPRFRLVVPVELENLPAAVSRGRIECQVASTPAFSATHSLGRGSVEFAIEGGRFSGRLGMDIVVTGAPLGVDGTTEGRSYACSLFLMYQCTRPDSSEPGWCTTGPGVSIRDEAIPAVRALFATDPARPPTGRIEGTIDRDSAVTLPIRG